MLEWSRRKSCPSAMLEQVRHGPAALWVPKKTAICVSRFSRWGLSQCSCSAAAREPTFCSRDREFGKSYHKCSSWETSGNSGNIRCVSVGRRCQDSMQHQQIYGDWMKRPQKNFATLTYLLADKSRFSFQTRNLSVCKIKNSFKNSNRCTSMLTRNFLHTQFGFTSYKKFLTYRENIVLVRKFRIGQM